MRRDDLTDVGPWEGRANLKGTPNRLLPRAKLVRRVVQTGRPAAVAELVHTGWTRATYRTPLVGGWHDFDCRTSHHLLFSPSGELELRELLRAAMVEADEMLAERCRLAGPSVDEALDLAWPRLHEPNEPSFWMRPRSGYFVYVASGTREVRGIAWSESGKPQRGRGVEPAPGMTRPVGQFYSDAVAWARTNKLDMSWYDRNYVPPPPIPS